MILVKLFSLFPLVTHRAIYFYLHYIKNYRAQRLTAHAKIYLPELTDHKAFIKDFHWQWASYIAEMCVLLTGTTRKQVEDAITFTNPELLHEHLAAGHKVVLCSTHSAATDWVWQGVTIEFGSYDIRVVGHSLGDEYNQRLGEARTRYGGGTVFSHEVGKLLLGNKAKPDVLMLVGDFKLKQESNTEKDLMPFLGHKMYMYTATPKLARLMGAHVVYGEMRRTAPFRTEVTLVDLSPPPKSSELDDVQDRYVREVEKSIRRNPGGWWFWNKELVFPEAGPLPEELRRELDY